MIFRTIFHGLKVTMGNDMSLHCVWAWCNFLYGGLVTCWEKPYRDCVEIVQCWYSCHAVSVESARICTAVMRAPYRSRTEMVQLL